MNAPAALTIPCFSLLGVRAWWRWLRGLSDSATFQPEAWHAWVIVASLAAFSVMRNLPWAPFTWLAPQ